MSEVRRNRSQSSSWISRRRFLGSASAVALAGLRPIPGAPAPLFEEIPPEKSGIRWVHDNAMSDKRYLPETMGPGCAFLDYDNAGEDLRRS